MEGTIINGQTCLETRGITARKEQITRNVYTNASQDKMYGPTHSDAMATGDIKGKGRGGSGHLAWTPDCTKDTHTIDYSNFNTVSTDSEPIGGLYDIEGREGIGGRRRAVVRSLYSREKPYGLNLISTEMNQAEGQVVIK